MEKLNVAIGTRFTVTGDSRMFEIKGVDLDNNSIMITNLDDKGETAHDIHSVNSFFKEGLWVQIKRKSEPLDLTKILKVGDKVYSTIYGDSVVQEVRDDGSYPIVFYVKGGSNYATADGKHYKNYNGECTLFPSRENRDWSTWKREGFKKGGLCLFWDYNEDEKHPGIFHSKDEDGYHDSIFTDGKLTKFSCWENCELYNPENIEI